LCDRSDQATRAKRQAQSGAGTTALAGSPFVVPGARLLDGEQQVAAEEKAKLESPEAVRTREESRTKFENLNTEQAAKADGEAFPELVDDPVGGPPLLPAGQKIVSFPSDNVAQVEYGGEKRGVIEAWEPMAVETSGGHRVPIDLSLSEAGGEFEPTTPAVGVKIPKRLSDGVQIPALSLSLTPVDAQSSTLAGSEGSVVGAGVLYANTQTDTDTFVKPTTAGFEADTLLRSVESPEVLYFRVGLPESARLLQIHGAAGPVEIIVEGQTVALIRPPSVTDAAGTSVPVSVSVKGDVLAVTVASHTGEYQWPLEVDPELVSITDSATGENSNWMVTAEKAESFGHTWHGGTLELWALGGYNPSERDIASYLTQGESKIYKLEADTVDHVAKGKAILGLAHKGKYEAERLLVNKKEEERRAEGSEALCANSGCPESGGNNENAAIYEIEATEPNGDEPPALIGDFWDPRVYIAQEKPPEVTFNESASELEVEPGVRRLNAMYGSHGTGGKEPWLGPYSNTAFEVKAHDPGIGISWAEVYAGGFRQEAPIYEDGECKGVQCKENYSTFMTYNPEMANGEYDVNAYATDLAGRPCEGSSCQGLEGINGQLIKVDATPPEKLEVSGWPKSREISATPHALTVEATDGAPKESHSSGIKSIAVSVDGGPESPVSSLKCSNELCTLGPNTGTGKYTLDAENLSEGVHRLVVTATDYADNVASKEFTFDVRHGSPVSVGPGLVDPTTGQLKLSATDVSLAGSGAVSRVYESRDLAAGAEGPLGPQWAISLGGGQELTALPTGSVVLTSPAGGDTTFTRNEKGEFESPLGDSNLKVEVKEKEPGKGISEYLLVDASAGTTTSFTQPEGVETSTPLYTNQFGDESYGLNGPGGVAIAPNGDVWVADTGDDRLVEYSAAGVLLNAYGTKGSGSDELNEPSAVSVNQSTGSVYVVDSDNNRIDVFNSSGVFEKALGWGVSEGGNRLEVCSVRCKAGRPGSNPGQFDYPEGLDVDTSGDIWVADSYNNRIEEFSEGLAYVQEFGSRGDKEGQLEYPAGVALSGGNVYVTDLENNRVEEFTTAGKYVSQFGKEGDGNGEFYWPTGIAADPRTGNLYVTDFRNNRVEEFNAEGKFITTFDHTTERFDGEYADPHGITVNSSGGVYVVEGGSDRVQEWSRPQWFPTLTKGAAPAATTTYGYGPTEEEEGKVAIAPTEALATPPAGVECGTKPSELKKGCRALTFQYATETTASGENPSQWGQYKGRLIKISFHAYNPAKGAEKMEEKVTAEYSYDKRGRLRAEWDPRISPAVKTTYGYDAEGYVTAVTPPNQQGWVFTYGTIGGDSNPGRLLKVTRAQPKVGATEEKIKEVLHEQELATKNTGAPQLSGTAVVGVTMGVSSGSWSDSPIAYGYQWEDCNSEGKACTPILGATDANYKVASSDVGHKLVVLVSAMNGDGAVVEPTAASAVVASSGTKTEGTAYSPEPGSTIEYRVPISGTGLPTLTKEEVEKAGQKDEGEQEDNDPVEGIAVFPPDEAQGWPASDYKRATIDYMNEKGLTVNTASPTGGITTSEYNEANEVVRTLSADNRATALGEGCKSVSKKECKSAEVSEKLDTKTTYNPEDSEILKVIGPEHKVKLASGSEVEARSVIHDYYDEGAPEGAYDVVTKSTAGALLSDGEEKDVRTTETLYGGQGGLGWTLRKPTSVTTDPGGLNLTDTTVYNPTTGNVEETKASGSGNESKSSESTPPSYSSAFGSAGTKTGEFEEPEDLAVDSSGDVWVADTYNNRVQEFNGRGEFIQQVGSQGKGEGQLENPQGVVVTASDDVWIADTDDNRLEEFTSEGKLVRTVTDGFYQPEALATNSAGDIWVVDSGNNRLVELNSEGAQLKTISGLGEGGTDDGGASGVAVNSSGDVYVAFAFERGAGAGIKEYSSEGTLIHSFASFGSEPGQFESPQRLAVGPEGYLWVAEYGNDRVQVFSGAGEYKYELRTRGSNETNKYNEDPMGVAISGSKVYVLQNSRDSENTNRVEEWTLGPPVTYQGAFGTSDVSLPVTTVTYNMWDEVETTTEQFGAGSGPTTRTKTQTYDAAGRAVTSEETSRSADKGLPKVTNEYNTETGVLEKQSTTTEGKTKTITSKYNTLGQLAKYTDAAGGVTTYAYETGGDDRLEEVSMEGPEGEKEREKGYQTYSYNTTSGFMERVVDSAAHTFTASYDVEGKMTSEIYPNGMTATTTYNSVGAATSIEYIKTVDCASKCPETWFSDADVPSIHGEPLEQMSTLSKESYVYDEVGRLTETQETPAGKGCKTRVYGYDEESDRTSETARESSTETCATTGGTTETHSYDAANRLIDSGVEYESLGNITKLPAGDAGGSEGGHELKSTYYADSQVATQEQNGETISYAYDPAGRNLETVSKGKTSATVISHYAGSGAVLAWTSEEEGKKWSRNIPGIDGTLDAIQTSGGSTVLQLHDLQGDIVGTVEDGETVTKLASTYDSTEFGVPQSGTTPPKYSWLGAGGVATEPSLSSGVSIQGGASYVPEVARDLQTYPVVPPGAFPNGSGTDSPYTAEIPGWLTELEGPKSAATLAEWAAELKAKEEEARKHVLEEEERRNREIAEIGQKNVENEENYEYEQAQALAGEASEEGEDGNATIASYKLRLSTGCLDAGFWTYCSAQYDHKWYNKKYTTPPEERLSTAGRVIAGTTGAIVTVAGGGAAVGCIVAAGATAVDDQFELLPLEVHCILGGGAAMLAGAYVMYEAIFGG
jgi:DNA-binding beta-propeller fold protein YncE